MATRNTVIGLCCAGIAAAILLGCGDKASGDAASSASAAANAPAKSGEAKGGDSAAKKEKVQADKAYVECHFTKSYPKDEFGEEKPEFECKNTTDKDFNFLQFKVFYYDKDKKQVDSYLSAKNGQPILKAGETKKFAIGKKKGDQKPEAQTPQAMVLEGSFGDGNPWEYKDGMKYFGSDRPMVDE